MKQTRLEILLEAYLNRALTEEQRAELERLLLSSSEARQRFWDQARFHSLLSHWGQQEWGRRLAQTPSAEARRWPARMAGLILAVRHRFPWNWGWAAGLAGAACLMLAIALLIHRPPKPISISQELAAVQDFHSESPAGVAVLTRAAFVQWMDPTNAPMNGAALAPGWLRFKLGAIQVEFSSGARVIVEGPAELEIVSARAAFLQSGRLSAFVPPAARGFEVRSPQLALVDYGTEFGMAVPLSGPAEAHVFTGKAEVAETSRKSARHALTEGQAVRVQGNTFQPIPAQPGAFLREEQLAHRERDWETQRYEHWKRAVRAISEDPATLVHYTFEGQPGWQRMLTNHAANAAPATLGNIVGCEWTEGRWPRKGALEFKGRAERVKLEIPGQFAALTYFAWVCVDALPHAYHSLLMTEGEHTGAVHWSLTHAGEVRIGAVPEKTNAPAAWNTLNSLAVTSDQLGHWICLASVVENERLLNYVNGQLVGQSPRPNVPLRLGRAELGNWGATRETPGMEWADRPAWFWNRGLKGRMDEFALLARALSAEEIRRLYEQGRPGSEPVTLAESK
jgi:hypothetical protein